MPATDDLIQAPSALSGPIEPLADTASQSNQNQDPVILQTTFFLDQDALFYDFLLAANDLGFDPEGEDLFFDTIDGVDNGSATIFGSGYFLSFQPDPGFVGTETIEVTISDRTAQGTSQLTVLLTLIVEPVGNQPPVAQDDVLSFDADSIYIDPKTGLGEVSFSRYDLTANDQDDDFDGDGFNLLQMEVVDSPSEGTLQLIGEASFLTYYFDPATHPGTETFTYRILDEENATSNVVTVTLSFSGLPAPEPDPSTLYLVDAASDTVLFDLSDHVTVHAAAVAGRNLSAGSEYAGSESARMFLDGAQTRIENVEAYALFGDRKGDFKGGLSLEAGDTVTIGAEYYAQNRARGEQLGQRDSIITVLDDLAGAGIATAPDTFVFDVTKMGTARLTTFDEIDTLALFGGAATSAEAVLALATIDGEDTLIDFGEGNILTLKGFTTLSANDLAV